MFRAERESTCGVLSKKHPPPAATDDDPVTFSVNVLPVEAFEALLVATSFLGDPWVIDEPYELTALLDPPLACRCYLSLVPEAIRPMVAMEHGIITIASNRADPLTYGTFKSFSACCRISSGILKSSTS